MAALCAGGWRLARFCVTTRRDRQIQDAGVADRIELRVGPGLATLRALPPGEQFDFAFIDADKTGYAQYYEEVLARYGPEG